MPSWSICTNSRLSAPAAMTNTHVFGYHCPRRPCACVHFCEMLLTEHLRMPYGWLTEVSAGRNREKKNNSTSALFSAPSVNSWTALMMCLLTCARDSIINLEASSMSGSLRKHKCTPSTEKGWTNMLMWQSFGFLYKKKDHLNIFRNKPNLDVGFLSQLAFHP